MSYLMSAEHLAAEHSHKLGKHGLQETFK